MNGFVTNIVCLVRVCKENIYTGLVSSELEGTRMFPGRVDVAICFVI